MKLTTIIILIVVMYVGYGYVKRYQEMEIELTKLRGELNKEDNNEYDGPSKWMQIKDQVVSALEGMLLKMPSQ